jgi:UDP-GlcNAc:undecaprenyl-phosphate GlcNAc-1-phosphate transferase
MRSGDEFVFGLMSLGLAALAFVLSLVLCGLARRWAPRLGLLDRPGGHKGHRAPTPLGGGVAIWLATVAVLGLAALATVLAREALPEALTRYISGAWSRARELAEIVVMATVIMIVGLIDDRFGLGWRPRLAIQVGLATLLAALGVRVTLFWPFTHPLLGGAVTVLWIVALTNSFNMLDNMDGLAASVGLIAALLFAGAQLEASALFVPAVLLILAGALGGFLVHNWHPARIFMGDAGSNFLGFLLGALTVSGTYYRYDGSPTSVLAPLLVMAVPLYDMSTVILIRLHEGRSPFLGDRRHFSHRLVGRGLTPTQAVRTIDLVTLASGLGALLLHRLDVLGACVVVAQTASLLGVVAILEVSASESRPENAQVPNNRPIPQGYTRVYRVVSQAEYQDILRSGQLRPGPNSLEGKWFSDSLEGAKAHGMALYPSEQYRLVEVNVPDHAPSLFKQPNLDGRGPARYLHMDDLKGIVPQPLE